MIEEYDDFENVIQDLGPSRTIRLNGREIRLDEVHLVGHSARPTPGKQLTEQKPINLADILSVGILNVALMTGLALIGQLLWGG